MSRRLSKRHILPALVLSLSIGQAASAQPGCEVYKNLSHCPLKDAVLELAPDGSQLRATNLGTAGKDGLVTQFDTATQWRAQMSVDGAADELTFEAYLDGDITAAARFDDSATTTVLRTRFTGAAGHHTFTAEIYLDGDLVAQFPDLDETSDIGIGRIPIPEPIPMPGPWPWPDFKRGPLGRCMWDFSFATSVSFSSPNGEQATGDRIRLVENLDSGHYPYVGFSAIAIRSNGSSITLTDEEVSTH